MKKKRKIFQTPEEYEAWKARGEAIQRDLREHIERIQQEPGIFATPEEREAWMADPEARHQYLLHRIERAQAEIEAKRKSA